MDSIFLYFHWDLRLSKYFDYLETEESFEILKVSKFWRKLSNPPELRQLL
jgi:hypothetical protein